MFSFHHVLATVGVCTAVFFVDLYKPFYYFWMYGGVVMRLVICMNEQPVVATEKTTVVRQSATRRDNYGWAQPAQSGGTRS